MDERDRQPRRAEASRPLRVAVLMGGRSGEHDVSLASGEAVVRSLSVDRFEALPVLIDREGRWHLLEAQAVREAGSAPVAGEGLDLPEGLRGLLDRRPDVAFIAMHGPEGEDGRLQSLLELVGLPFVGSDADASSLAMNKPVAKAVYRAAGLPVAEDRLLGRAEWLGDPEAVVRGVREVFSPPYVLKTPRLGSSVGLDILPDPGALPETLGRLFALDDRVLVEAFVRGRELTCGVLEGSAFGGLRALPVLEIIPVESDFFDFHAKYTPGAVREVCPAPLPEAVWERIQALGLAAHQALGCRGVSRTDFIWSEPTGSIVILETNTIPGLTETSLLPQQAAAAGISFPDLVAGLLLGAMESPA